MGGIVEPCGISSQAFVFTLSQVCHGEVEALTEALEIVLLRVEPHMEGLVEAFGESVYRFHFFPAQVEEEGGYGGGRFEAGMRHGINHGVVAFVPDAGKDGQGKLCHVGSKEVGIETSEVAHGSAAANDDNGIPFFDFSCNVVECGNHAAFCFLSLHRPGKGVT